VNAPIGRLSFSRDGKSRHTLRASCRADRETVKALREAAKRDETELPTMESVLRYCLELGVEVYLQGQPEGSGEEG